MTCDPPNREDHNSEPPASCRWGSREYVDVSIHDGQSVRRDCAARGRFVDFTVWYGRRVADSVVPSH